MQEKQEIMHKDCINIGTIFGVFVIPILFVIFQGLQERITGKPVNTKEKDVAFLEEENEK